MSNLTLNCDLCWLIVYCGLMFRRTNKSDLDLVKEVWTWSVISWLSLSRVWDFRGRWGSVDGLRGLRGRRGGRCGRGRPRVRARGTASRAPWRSWTCGAEAREGSQSPAPTSASRGNTWPRPDAPAPSPQPSAAWIGLTRVNIGHIEFQ